MEMWMIYDGIIKAFLIGILAWAVSNTAKDIIEFKNQERNGRDKN